jgi:poly-gamma-glutamate synthase PgsB/CapB
MATMLFLYTVFGLSLVTLFFLGAIEQRRHLAALESIPERVLVNGIRGKSSITRLVAGALRGGGLRVVAKTTGTAARFIGPEGTDEPIERPYELANVIEQVHVVRRAAAERPDVLVIECMAVQPALQEVNQGRLIRSTVGVLSNVREDHLEEMGPTLDDVARSLSRSMPVGGVCVTAESARFHVLQEEAARRNCRLVYADPDSVTDEELGGFSYIAFKENVAIALAVARELGLERGDALRGVWRAAPDPGVLTVERYELDGTAIRFANVFAANDPRSTVMNVQRLRESGLIEPPLFVLVNCRPDRVERNRQMGEVLPQLGADKAFVIGHPARSAIAAVPKEWHGDVIDLGGDRGAGQILSAILAEVGSEAEASLVAVGNIHGQGELLLDHLETLRRTG